MPRDGSGVMSKVAGTTAVSGTTVESAKYNTTIDDLITDANTVRPVVAGGTGAATASAARTNLGLGTIATQAASAVAVTGGTIDGAAIDGATIGATTPAAGTFTTFSMADQISTTGTSGITFKNSAGTTIGALSDTGTLTLSGPLVSGANQIQEGPPVAITAAATLPVTNASNTFTVSGVTTVTALASLPSGTRVTLILAAATPFTHSAALKMPGGVSFTGASGDVLQMLRNGTNWECVGGVKADGTAFVASASGMWAPIATNTITAATATSEFTLSSAYEEFEIRGYIWPETTATKIGIQVSTDGGTTYDTNGYSSGIFDYSAATYTIGGSTHGEITKAITNNEENRAVFSLRLLNANTAVTRFSFDCATMTLNGSLNRHFGYQTSVSSFNAIRIKALSGNILASEATLYGRVVF